MIPTARRHPTHFVLVALLGVLFVPAFASAQLISFSKQELTDYTAQNPFDRLSDGRPKVPDELIERARGLSSEEVWAVLQEKQFNNQYADGFQVLHPGKTMVGRAFTVQFMSGWTVDPEKGLVRDPQSASYFKFKLNDRVRSERGEGVICYGQHSGKNKITQYTVQKDDGERFFETEEQLIALPRQTSANFGPLTGTWEGVLNGLP